jgi:hypothetical protein
MREDDHSEGIEEDEIEGFQGVGMDCADGGGARVKR